MRIFVIHSGSDRVEVEKYTKLLKNNTVSTEILVLKNGGKLWKIDARSKIKQAQLVLVFVGEHSHESKNIEWEINRAYAFKKEIITICLKPEYPLPSALTKEDGYSQDKHQIGALMTFEEMVDYINSYTSGDYSLFNSVEEKIDKELLLEQYKAFLATSEALVERRQNVSNFYISVNSAIVVIFSSVLALAGDTRWKYAACLGFPVMGIVLCTAWIKVLRSYGNLNAGKMRIISIIEKQLPASLYDAEWRAQSDKLNSRPYVSFTESEMRIPKIFIIIYLCVIIACLISAVFSLII